MKFLASSSGIRLLTILTTIIISAAVLGGCSSKDPVEPTPAPVTTCVAWTGQTTGTRHSIPGPIVDNNVTVILDKFYWSNGDSTTGGFAEVQNSQLAGGSGLDVFCNNINLNFQFVYPCNRITFKFADYGGNENLRVNGQLANVSQILQLHGTTLGGVSISVVGSQPGTITLEGTINSFKVGGQEFLIDDICSTRPGS